MDANQIERLKALALAATPGPWAANNWTCHVPTTIKSGDIVVAETMGFGRHSSECAIDAAYIAEANPAAVLELIAEVERLHAAPAAGTVEKDAERYQLMRAQLSSGDLDYYRLEGQPQAEIDEYCDAEIAAHTKAGKDNA